MEGGDVDQSCRSRTPAAIGIVVAQACRALSRLCRPWKLLGSRTAKDRPVRGAGEGSQDVGLAHGAA